MKMKSFLWLSALCALLVFQRCSDDDAPTASNPLNGGVLVANEGGFLKANATVTYYNPETDSIAQNIYRNAGGQYAGDVLQSITLTDDRAYLVLNGSNAVEIADAKTFARVGTFTNPELLMPRYMEVINGKGYVSFWGSYAAEGGLEGSAIQVVNLQTLQVEKTIDTNDGVETLLYNGRYLFVANNNLGIGNTVSAIDPATNAVVKDITVGDGPSGMVTDADGKLWVITTGGYGATSGDLYRIHPTTFTVEQQIHLDYAVGGDIASSPDGRKIYYSAGTDIYSIATNATKAPETPLVEAADVAVFYSLGVNPNNGDIYVGDALDYTSAGKVYVYDAAGALKTSFAAGISPGQFIFK
jgi:YVTN family beta-propeller protein